MSQNSVFSQELVGLNKPTLIRYQAGIHHIDKIDSDLDFFAITGEGSGITILVVPGGINLTGEEPRLKGFTLVGYKNTGTGITLRNNKRVLIDDVEVRGYELGLLSVCDYGKRQWLHTYRDLYVYEGIDGSQRTYNTKIRGVELLYVGDKIPNGGWKSDGGFSNTHTFYGGRIAVPGIPLLIDGPSATSMYGIYIDISDAPVVVTERSPGLQLFGVQLDRSRRAKKNNIPVLMLKNPKYNRVKIFGQHLGLMSNNLIVDDNGMPVLKEYLFISPDYY